VRKEGRCTEVFDLDTHTDGKPETLSGSSMKRESNGKESEGAGTKSVFGDWADTFTATLGAEPSTERT